MSGGADQVVVALHRYESADGDGERLHGFAATRSEAGIDTGGQAGAICWIQVKTEDGGQVSSQVVVTAPCPDTVWMDPEYQGHEEGEGSEETARREVREETGIEAEIEEDLGKISYFYVWEGIRVKKSVHFYLMRATGGDVSRHDHEMEDVRWFPAGEALRLASYKTEREVLSRAAEELMRERPAEDGRE